MQKINRVRRQRLEEEVSHLEWLADVTGDPVFRWLAKKRREEM